MSEQVYAGIDIGATNIKYGLVNKSGTVSYRNQVATPSETSAEKLFEKILLCGEQLLIEADDLGGEVKYVGVGSPGSVNRETGVVQGTCPNIPYWVGFHLRDRLAECLNLKVEIDNDANCAAWAEYLFGAGKGYRHVLCLTIGTGIGGGLILNDAVYRGTDFSAGEVGHMLLSGVAGHTEPVILESVVSAPAILAWLRERLTEEMTPAFKSILNDDLSNLTMRRVFSAMKKGDRLAPEVMREKGEILGTALAGLLNVINPEIVILGGGVAEGGSLFVDTVKKTVLARALPVVAESLAVAPAQLGNAAGFIGAAFLGETGESVSQRNE